MTTRNSFRRLPAVRTQRVDAAEAAEMLELADGSRTPIALVVDDEPLVRRFVSTILRREGWSVLEAGSADAALALADAGPFDLLITDYEMPDVTGVALARLLRTHDEDLPVLMVSGHPDAAGAMLDLDGRTAFALKPFAAEELVSRVCSIVG